MVVRVQTKLSVLICSLIICFLAGLLVLQSSERQRALLLLENRRQEKQELTQELIRLRGISLQTFAYDYSFWDDMVRFVRTNDPAWAHDNIDIGLSTYAASAAWVFGPDRSYVYSVSDSRYPNLCRDSAILTAVTGTLKGTSFQHFFVNSGRTLLELQTAPIQPSSDITRQTPALGYLVAGRIWSTEFLADLSRSASCSMTVAPADGTSQDTVGTATSAGSIAFDLPFLGCNDQPMAVLHCTNYSAVYAELTRISNREVIYLAVFALLITGLLLVSLSAWVSRPLRLISRSLQEGNSDLIKPLQSATSEFGQVVGLIQQFFEQKQELVNQVTDRESIARALRESQRALETLMANLPGMAYRCKNDIDWTMSFVSQGCHDLTGYRPEELIGNAKTSYGHLIHSDDQQMVWDNVQVALEKRQPFRITYRLHDAQNNIRWVLEHGRGVYTDAGDLAAIEGFVLDITERISAEEEKAALEKRLDRAQRMESLAILAGGVAHDLNNLLGPVVAYPDMILMKLPPDSPVRSQVEMISQSAQQAVNVIQDLLSLARRGRYEMKPTNLNEVVATYLKSPSCLEQQGRHGNVSLTARLDPSLGSIQGSTTHLMKAVMNLVVNAFDAMPEGGSLTISTSQRRMRTLQGGFSQIEPGEYVLLSVADTGSGIDAQNLSKIFEPYYSSKVVGKSGTGLGLAVVYGIIKDHKGYYDVFSKVGVGTEFVLYFPVTKAALSKDTTSTEKLDGNEKVLVVDDMPEQRQLARDLLASSGYAVDIVANGHEAIDYLKQFNADIVVIDMVMEKDFDGLDTYREILAFRPNQKAVIVSGFSATERIFEAQRLGAGPYVRKPYTRQTLCKAVREELDRRRLSALHYSSYAV